MKKLFLIATLIFCSSQLVADDTLFPELIGAGTAKRTSLSMLKKQYDWYRGMRKDLGASRRIGQQHWLPGYVGPMLGTGLGAGIAGLSALGLSDFSHQISNRRFRLPWYAAAPITSAATYGLYRLLALIGNKILQKRRHNQLERFVAVWPEHRKQASDEMRDLMKRIYASYSTTGSLGLSPSHENDLYQFLGMTLANREKDLAEQIKVQKKKEVARAKDRKKRAAAKKKEQKEAARQMKERAQKVKKASKGGTKKKHRTHKKK